MAIWAQRHYFKWVNRFKQVLVAPETELFARYDAPEIAARRKAYQKSYNKAALPRILGTYLPWYNPEKGAMPSQYDESRAHYSHVAIALS
jgi:hypothetical protein